MQKGSHRAKGQPKKAPRTARARRSSKAEAPSSKAEAPSSPSSSSPSMEGEGSYEGGRRYDRHAREFVESGAVEPSAREAEQALDRAEGDKLREAEAEGKRRGEGDDQ